MFSDTVYTKDVSFPQIGLELHMNPEAFSIGGISVKWYGVIIAVGFLLAIIYGLRRAKKMNVDVDMLIDLLLIATPSAIIGARLYYIIFDDLGAYLREPLRILQIWEGGLAIYGGIIGAVIAALIFCKVKKISPANILDLAALGLMIGQAVGRWGNFVNAEVYGKVFKNYTDPPFWAMAINYGSPVHPLFLYESLWLIIGFAALHFYSSKRRFSGEIFCLYIAWYGLGRGLLEGLRAEAFTLRIDGIPVSQIIAFVSLGIAFALLAYNYFFKPNTTIQPLPVKTDAGEVDESEEADVISDDDADDGALPVETEEQQNEETPQDNQEDENN